MDTIDYTRFVFAFLFTIGLIGLAGTLLRRYSASNKLFGVKEEGARITVIESRYLDSKRRLVLIRRDDKEHLLLLSDGRELVIESFATNENSGEIRKSDV